MNEATLNAVVNEIAPVLTGQRWGRIYQLARRQLVIDFRLPDALYLFINLEPANTGLFLIKRKLRELEKRSINPNPFIQFLRKRLGNATLISITKDSGDRIVRFVFDAIDELGERQPYILTVQLTGRSANLFLLNAGQVVLDSLFETSEGQNLAGMRFTAPEPLSMPKTDEEFVRNDYPTMSEALDADFTERQKEAAFEAVKQSALAKAQKELTKALKLREKLKHELIEHKNTEVLKRQGDLILASISTAKRQGDKVTVTDFYDPALPTIEIEIAEHITLTDGAEKLFSRYTKGRRAIKEIEGRLTLLNAEIERLEERIEEVRQTSIDNSGELKDGTTDIPTKQTTAAKKQVVRDDLKKVRRYISSDGMEILVGKTSKDNDYLTFRIAKSLDYWFHAADYGGSHVVVRNPNRLPLPQKTLLEAAQLAAYFSQAKKQPKAAVHYTQKKFVNKPKGGAPGLASLASFKTVLVEPAETLKKIK